MSAHSVPLQTPMPTVPAVPISRRRDWLWRLTNAFRTGFAYGRYEQLRGSAVPLIQSVIDAVDTNPHSSGLILDLIEYLTYAPVDEKERVVAGQFNLLGCVNNFIRNYDAYYTAARDRPRPARGGAMPRSRYSRGRYSHRTNYHHGRHYPPRREPLVELESREQLELQEQVELREPEQVLSEPQPAETRDEPAVELDPVDFGEPQD